MPDSAWTTMTGDEAAQFETEFLANDMHFLEPVGTVSYHQDVATYDPPAPADFPPEQGFGPFFWITTRTDIFSLLFRTGVTPPDSQPVQQYCDRCGVGHTDTLVNGSQSPLGVPFGVPAHVPDYEYGYRDGNLYMRYRVSGAQLKRTTEIRKYEDMAINPEVQLGPAKWERKAIDHVEQGPYVHWLTAMRRKDCNTRLSKLVFDDKFVGAELMAMLYQVGATTSLLNDGGDIAELFAVAEGLEDPRVSVTAIDDGDLNLALSDRSGDGKLREVGTAKIRWHEGGFTTVTDWNTKSDGC